MLDNKKFSAIRVAVWASALFASAAAWAGSITIGTIGLDSQAEINIFLPLADYVAKTLHSEGIDQGKVVVVRAIRQMADTLQSGKVDLYIDSPFPSIAVARLSESRPFLRRWKKGLAEYHSVIFVKKESNLTRLTDLNGKKIAFEGPYSTAGYLLPKMFLVQQELRLVGKNADSDSVGPREVGYVFSNDDENTLFWVMRGRVTAGAMDQQNFAVMTAQMDGLKILEKTAMVPRHLVSHRRGLSMSLVAKLTTILTQMDQSSEGKKVLQQFEGTTRFDSIPKESLAYLTKNVKFIEKELNLQ